MDVALSLKSLMNGDYVELVMQNAGKATDLTRDSECFASMVLVILTMMPAGAEEPQREYSYAPSTTSDLSWLSTAWRTVRGAVVVDCSGAIGRRRLLEGVNHWKWVQWGRRESVD